MVVSELSSVAGCGVSRGIGFKDDSRFAYRRILLAEFSDAGRARRSTLQGALPDDSAAVADVSPVFVTGGIWWHVEKRTSRPQQYRPLLPMGRSQPILPKQDAAVS